MDNNPELIRVLEKQVTVDKAKDASGTRVLSLVPYQDKKWQPKRLSPKHKQILTLYCQGVTREEIGSLCRCTPALVTMLATSNLGQEYLRIIETAQDAELRGLYGASIAAIRDQLHNGSGENKLKAAKLQMQAIGKLAKTTDESESAEDVIQRIMNMQVNGDVNVTINNGGS